MKPKTKTTKPRRVWVVWNRRWNLPAQVIRVRKFDAVTTCRLWNRAGGRRNYTVKEFIEAPKRKRK